MLGNANFCGGRSDTVEKDGVALSGRAGLAQFGQFSACAVFALQRSKTIKLAGGADGVDVPANPKDAVLIADALLSIRAGCPVWTIRGTTALVYVAEHVVVAFEGGCAFASRIPWLTRGRSAGKHANVARLAWIVAAILPDADRRLAGAGAALDGAVALFAVAAATERRAFKLFKACSVWWSSATENGLAGLVSSITVATSGRKARETIRGNVWIVVRFASVDRKSKESDLRRKVTKERGEVGCAFVQIFENRGASRELLALGFG